MSVVHCSYENCYSKRTTHGSIPFFALPRDNRRAIWILNSGNKQLRKISDTAVRFFCEKHFEESDIRRQFHRTSLRKSAVPIPYQNPGKSSPSNSEEHSNSDDEFVEVRLFEKDHTKVPTDFDDDSSNLNISLKPERLEKQVSTKAVAELEPETNSIEERTVAVQSKEMETPLFKCDEDTNYLLSLVGYFRRMPSRTKAISKLRILEYLTELEINGYVDGTKL